MESSLGVRRRTGFAIRDPPVWLAVATRRGHGWTRVAGTVLLGIYSICALVVVFGTHYDAGPQFTTVVVWAIGVATVIPLWSQQARDFCYAWRKR